jgi:hypothetical protein
MTGQQFAQYIRINTKTNQATLPDSEIVLKANIVKDDIARRIADLSEDFFGAVAYAPLESGRREYPLPPDMLGYIKKVEIMLDGTNYLPIKELDLGLYPRATSEADILGGFYNFAGGAFYDIYRSSLWIYSGQIESVANGLKLWYIAFPADITVSTLSLDVDLSADPNSETAGMPRQIHELWAQKVIIEWKVSQPKPMPLSPDEQLWYQRMEMVVRSLANPNLGRSFQAPLPPSSERGYAGFEY